MDVAELQAYAARHYVLLAAGVDEEEILLPVVEEAEVLFRRRLLPGGSDRGRRARADQRQELGRRIARPGEAMLGDELVDAVQRLGRDARAVAQPRHELPIVDRAPSES